jgi:DNA polymerase-3 subunit epsilon
MRRPLFFDTETTGVRAEQDRIVEIAVYDHERQTSFCELVNPKMAIPKDAASVHGITDDMVSGAPDFASIGKKFIEFCSGEVALIGHNCDAFDVPFLKAEFARNGLTIPSEWIFIDSLKWARKYRRDLPKHALQFLRQMYGIEPNQAHRALADVMVLADVFQMMTDDLTCDDIIALLGCKLPKQEKKPLEDLHLFA